MQTSERKDKSQATIEWPISTRIACLAEPPDICLEGTLTNIWASLTLVKTQESLFGSIHTMQMSTNMKWDDAVFSLEDMYCIARSFTRSEYAPKYLGEWTPIFITRKSPLCTCIISRSAKITVMGRLSESEAFQNVWHIAKRIKFATSWTLQHTASDDNTLKMHVHDSQNYMSSSNANFFDESGKKWTFLDRESLTLDASRFNIQQLVCRFQIPDFNTSIDEIADHALVRDHVHDLKGGISIRIPE